MSTNDLNSFSATIERLFNKGVRYSTVIDIGCADGHFYLNHRGSFPGAVPLNIDANRLYEESLKAIKDVVGGNYCISAITDCVGEIEITESVHPYWSSIRPEGDLYWTKVNNLVKTKVKVSATTLDALARELALKPPFLLKLDVQGAEKAALAGARDVLENTNVVICEADIDDFQDTHEILVKSGFGLYDITELARVQDGMLGWFYPVYIKRALDFVRPKEFWNATQNDAFIELQVERRKYILKSNAAILDRIRTLQRTLRQSTDSKPSAAPTSRNQLCPCGSGRKYKHCCGALG
jgi:FkbM family methyltransferase